ncbi:helix-hairpin-helix domain-containing protein [Danxiaibacter flavus]|uniref:Helix-hairpin-helix domain-containing protein n=1 Tax=Danxiaibacter flavus TaxID=3049108 RepID=A0ABV3Z8F4_9BACT|nr:helix-hairpin-helix domain-containing protein [Chitinophagaceae bacterium DXS]
MNPVNWKDYLSFSKKERIAVFVLLALIFLLIIIPHLLRDTKEQIVIEELSANDSLNVAQEFPKSITNDGYDSAGSAQHEEAKNFSVFYFDPNALEEAGWRKLGVNEKTISTILHYRLKGGRFRKAGDLKKIYGLSAKDAERLVPYVQISDEVSVKPADKKNEVSKVGARKLLVINVNSATAGDLKTLPGIGDVLSERIIRFRNKLGHFSSIDEVGKTYGLPDSTFQKIKPYLVLE